MIVEPLDAPSIRPTIASDVAALKGIIDATDLFPSELLEDMIAPFFGVPCEERWLTAVAADALAGVAYFVRERMTEGTWNLLLTAVHPNLQRRGIGTELMRFIEDTLTANGERILIVETSGLPAFLSTREFYQHIGYEEEARIRDFYKSGEDKVVFRKTLSSKAEEDRVEE